MSAVNTKGGVIIGDSTVFRGGKMCQIVEGHNITVPRKSGGAREALFTDFPKKRAGPGPLVPLLLPTLSRIKRFTSSIVRIGQKK